MEEKRLVYLRDMTTVPRVVVKQLLAMREQKAGEAEGALIDSLYSSLCTTPSAKRGRRKVSDEITELRTEVSRLRDLRDALVDSMERQGDIPMTDALADALVAAGVDIHGKREVEVICETCLSRAECPSFKEGHACMYHKGGAA